MRLAVILEQVEDNVVQTPQPDALFNEAQQQRLQALMKAWRTAREVGSLPSREEAELEALVARS